MPAPFLQAFSGLLCLVRGNCGDNPPPPPPPPPPPASQLYQGDRFSEVLASSATGSCLTLTDSNRNREVTVQVRYPAEATTAQPVIVFSHGGGPRNACDFGNPEWGSTLARAGYVVVHLAHALNASDKDFACAAIGDARCDMQQAMLFHRPLDLGFVIDSLPAISSAYVLQGRLDASRIGIAGHSFGAFTVMSVAGARHDLGQLRDVDRRDARVLGVMALSPQGPDRFGWYDRGAEGNSWDAVSVPVLVQTGAGDTTDGEQAASRRVPFQLMPPPDKVEAYLDDRRAEHNTFNLNGNAPAAFFDYIATTGVAFFDATLQERDAAWAYLASDRLEQASQGLVQLSRKELAAPAGQ